MEDNKDNYMHYGFILCFEKLFMPFPVAQCSASRHARIAGSISCQDTFKKQPVMHKISGTIKQCLFLSLLNQSEKKKETKHFLS